MAAARAVVRAALNGRRLATGQAASARWAVGAQTRANGHEVQRLKAQAQQHRWIHASRACLGRVPFKLADIGEGIAEVEILQFFVKPGDVVKQFDKICEVQSDKATVEITSRFDGVIAEVKWKVGDMAPVGSTLVELEVEGAKSAPAPATEAPAPAVEPAQAAAKATAGDSLKQDPDQIVEIVRPSPVLERLGSFTVDPELRPAGQDLGPAPPLPRAEGERIRATPAVRRLARDHDLDLTLVPATGPGGRVLKGDVLAYIATVPVEERRRQASEVRSREASAVATAAAAPSADVAVEARSEGQKQAPAVSKLAEDVVVPVRGIQRIMVKSMVESLKIPHFNYMEEYDMSEMVAFRADLKRTAEARGLKLSYMPILIKAASLALTQFPQLNAHIKSDASEVTQKASHNIGVAMDTPRGLLVPVIRDCQNRSILDIAAEMGRLQELGANNKLGENELSGCTFTLSNIGAIGGTYASPIIPAPTVAIGAIGKIQTVPRFVDEKNTDRGVVAAKVMNISWAADHRVVDGASIARFSNQLKAYIENPLTMVADMS